MAARPFRPVCAPLRLPGAGRSAPTMRRQSPCGCMIGVHNDPKGSEMNQQQFASCIEACNACANACDMCASACLKENDVTAMAACIALDIDCADMCRLAAGAMARASQFAAAQCQLCADICDACADECAQHQAPHCQQCAQACRRCAEECRRMAGAGPGAQATAGMGAGAH